MPQPTELQKMLTTDEVAELLGVPVKTVLTWTSARAIAYHRVGRYNRYAPEDVKAFIDARRRRAAEVA
jgi:excisionase family DNA binding protein